MRRTREPGKVGECCASGGVWEKGTGKKKILRAFARSKQVGSEATRARKEN